MVGFPLGLVALLRRTRRSRDACTPVPGVPEVAAAPAGADLARHLPPSSRWRWRRTPPAHAASDGTVHPLTSYVINYVKFLVQYVLTSTDPATLFPGLFIPRLGNCRWGCGGGRERCFLLVLMNACLRFVGVGAVPSSATLRQLFEEAEERRAGGRRRRGVAA